MTQYAPPIHHLSQGDLRNRRVNFILPFIKAGGAMCDEGVDLLRGLTFMSTVV